MAACSPLVLSEPEFSYGSKRVRLSPTMPIIARPGLLSPVPVQPVQPVAFDPLRSASASHTPTYLASAFPCRSIAVSFCRAAARTSAAVSRSIKRSTGREPPCTPYPPGPRSPNTRGCTHGVPRSSWYRDPGSHQDPRPDQLDYFDATMQFKPASHVSPSPIKFWLHHVADHRSHSRRVPEKAPRSVARRVSPLASAGSDRLHAAAGSASPLFMRAPWAAVRWL